MPEHESTPTHLFATGESAVTYLGELYIVAGADLYPSPELAARKSVLLPESTPTEIYEVIGDSRETIEIHVPPLSGECTLSTSVHRVVRTLGHARQLLPEDEWRYLRSLRRQSPSRMAA